MSKISVLLVEDHELVRAGFKQILKSESGFTICGEVSNGLSCLSEAEKSKPDLILLDISIPKLSGIGVIKQLKNKSSKTKILVLTAAEGLTVLEEALNVGADGVALKSISKDELLKAIKYITSKTYSDAFIHSDISSIHPKLLQASKKNKNLTGREKQVLKLVAHGFRTTDIAVKLLISNRTVSKHRENIMNKTGLTTPAEMTNYASESGLLHLKLNEIR